MTAAYYAPNRVIKVDGLMLAADITQRVVSVQYDNSIDSADMFTITVDNADLSLTDSALLNVGKDVEVHMGYGADVKPMMLGEITAIEPSFPSGGAPQINVVGYDKSHRMRSNSPGRHTFSYMNDSLIATQIAGENLLIPIVDPAPITKETTQQTGSDWALLKMMAERNFFDLYVWWDKLYFRFPRPQTEQIVLEWGKNLSSFSPRLSTSGQIGVQQLQGYDNELAQAITMVLPAVAVGGDIEDIVERLGDGFLQQLVNLGRHVVRGRRITSYAEATVVAKSVLLRTLQGLYEGRGTCIGIPDLRAGSTIEIRGVGKRFGGIYKVTRVSHTIDGSGYNCSFQLSQRWNDSILKSLRRKVTETPSPNQAQSNQLVTVGVVESNQDPRMLGRVQLSFPNLSDQNLSAWAPIANQMAGSDAGTYFVPDRGDRVLVAFADGDISQPFVVGGFWDQQHRPPETNADGQNSKKLIRLKSGMEIRFDETPGAERLELKDRAGSKVVLDSATGNIVIEAINDVVIKSGPAGKIDLNPP